MVTSQSNTINMNITDTDDNGNQQPVLFAGYTVRSGAGLNINIDLHNPTLAAKNFASIQTQVNQFIEAAKAAALAVGVPVGNASE